MEEILPQPTPWMMIPFGLLLTVIALAPLFFSRWWDRNFVKVTLSLGVVPLAYYLLGLHATDRVLETTHAYISFIVLIGSLFVVAGGIHIHIKGEATPLVNMTFLFVGAIIANVLGTTGASMLLIRPWIRMNKYRITAHHIVFFIFIISNVGGCLTPIGDPPLFLGYLYGVPFWWVAAHGWPIWILGVGVLLSMFFAVDWWNFTRAPRAVRALETAHENWRFDGLSNLFFLAVILGAVFINGPVFLREAVMAAAALASYLTTKQEIHQANHFNFHPIKEVAILFVGIFATMMPALDWLTGNATALLGHQPTAGLFFWSSGLLSSVLDNVPTYLSFLSAMFGTFLDHDVVQQVQQLVANGGTGLASLTGVHAEQIRNTLLALQQYHGDHVLMKSVSGEEIGTCFLLGNLTPTKHLLAVSIGAVFWGANTYLGNGPNFMVKAIADQQNVHTPSFITYLVKYTLPCMGPMLLAVWWIFFR